MPHLKAMLAAVVAGVIGAAAWAAVAYFFHYEIGLLAWGIGGLVGFAVLYTANSGGIPTAAIAVVATVLSIVAGKYVAVDLMVNELFADPGSAFMSEWESEEQAEAAFATHVDGQIDGLAAAQVDAQIDAKPDTHPADVLLTREGDSIMFLADRIVEEREAAGMELHWPEDVSEDAEISAHYPAGVWFEAQHRWTKLSEAERDTLQREMEQEDQETMKLLREFVKREAFRESFTLVDFVFFGLGIFTAARLGMAEIKRT